MFFNLLPASISLIFVVGSVLPEIANISFGCFTAYSMIHFRFLRFERLPSEK